MTLEKKKVWVEVEVVDYPAGERGKVVGGVDVERAREAHRELMAFVPEYGPQAVFNDSNPMYTPRPTISEVCAYKKVDPSKVELVIRLRMEERVNQLVVADRITADEAAKARAGIPEATARVMSTRGESSRYAVVVARCIGITTEELEEQLKGDDDRPFFSEAYLYTLVGKDIARSVLGMMRELKYSLGIEDPWA